MDFGWTTYFNGFWVLPLLCFLFMAVMMIAFFGMRFLGHRGSHAGCCGRADAREEQPGAPTRDAKA